MDIHLRKKYLSLLRIILTQAVTCRAKALEYSEEAVKCGGTLKIHIKVDTGMSRLGYLCDGDYFESGVEGICEGCTLPGLDAEEYSHILQYLMNLEKNMKAILSISLKIVYQCD
ncbi:MAG: alanine racemase [Lachnospira eligens]